MPANRPAAPSTLQVAPFGLIQSNNRLVALIALCCEDSFSYPDNMVSHVTVAWFPMSR